MTSNLTDSTDSAEAPTHTAPAKAGRRPLHTRNFLLLWTSQTSGELGAQIGTVAIPLLALIVLDASVLQVSYLTALAWAPYLVLSLPAGVLVDRFDPRHLMMLSDVGRLLLLGFVPVAALLGLLSMPYLFAVSALSGSFTVLFNVAYRTLLPRVVAPGELVAANGRLSLSTEVAELVGPAAAGALVAALGAARTFVGNALAYLVSAFALSQMNQHLMVDARPEDDAELELKGSLQGLKFVRREPVLRSILACTTTSNFFVMASGAIEVVFLVKVLDASPQVVGLVFTISALGGITAGLMSERIAARVGSARIIWLAMLLPGPFYFLMPLAQPGWGVILFGLGLAAFSANVVLYNTAAASYQQHVTPPSLLGRVNAGTLWVGMGVVPFGALTGGALGHSLGLRTALLICVLGTWSACLWVVFSPLRRMRDMPHFEREQAES